MLSVHTEMYFKLHYITNLSFIGMLMCACTVHNIILHLGHWKKRLDCKNKNCDIKRYYIQG